MLKKKSGSRRVAGGENIIRHNKNTEAREVWTHPENTWSVDKEIIEVVTKSKAMMGRLCARKFVM